MIQGIPDRRVNLDFLLSATEGAALSAIVLNDFFLLFSEKKFNTILWVILLWRAIAN